MLISSKSQCQIIVKHLIAHGYITQLIASNYGIRRLASRMYDLKQEKLQFTVEHRVDDTGVRYAYYSMAAPERANEQVRLNRGLGWALDSELKAA